MSDGEEKLYVDARTLLHESVRLARQVWEDGYRPDCLVGLWRGGTPPAIAIHEFFRFQGLDPYHTAIKAQSYRGLRRGGAGVQVEGLGDVLNAVGAEDCMLIVDDVFDTGHTMAAVVQEIRKLAGRNAPEIRVATVYYKPDKNETALVPDYYAVADNRWIVFPHELEGLTDEELRRKGPEIYAVLFDEEER